jgi:hypothetical protein
MVMNSWSPMMGGLNLLLSKEIRKDFDNLDEHFKTRLGGWGGGDRVAFILSPTISQISWQFEDKIR